MKNKGKYKVNYILKEKIYNREKSLLLMLIEGSTISHLPKDMGSGKTINYLLRAREDYSAEERGYRKTGLYYLLLVPHYLSKSLGKSLYILAKMKNLI